MNIMSLMGTDLASATGNVAKAVLVIKNAPSIFHRLQKDNTIVRQAFSSLPSGKSVSEADITARVLQEAGISKTDLEKKSNDMVSSVMKLASDTLKEINCAGDGISYSRLKKKCGLDANTNDYLFLEVMYNPASVVISSSGGRYMGYDRGGELGCASNCSVVERNMPTTKKLSFKMIIEDLNNYDAFGTQLNTSLTISNVKDLVMGAVCKYTHQYSVKSKCEALLGLLNYDFLQDVIFCYGKMVFHGSLINMGVKYTMFNTNGNPIRAEVSMQLLQLSSNDSADRVYWKNAYDKYVCKA